MKTLNEVLHRQFNDLHLRNMFVLSKNQELLIKGVNWFRFRPGLMWLPIDSIIFSLFYSRSVWAATAMSSMVILFIKQYRIILKQREEIKFHANNLSHYATIGELSSGIIHDIASPITALSLSAEAIQRGDTERKDNLIKEAERIVKVSNTLNNVVCAAQKNIKNGTKKEKFMVEKEIADAVSILRFKSRSEGVEIIYPEKFRTSIVGDPCRLYQIVQNILSNAIDAYDSVDFKNDKKVVISVTNKNRFVSISIKDNGCGIKPENIKKIFERFYTTKKAKSGTGIGLYQTKEIVEKEFGGKIKVKSRQNKGTEFIILIKRLN